MSRRISKKLASKSLALLLYIGVRNGARSRERRVRLELVQRVRRDGDRLAR